ncbi:MAG TPA: phage portal protein [Tepidisphaeraceae bacterium]|jgi:HK97 family phage portal protein|nr:phage portal protein [Tepidisphaeraceae bacterium]
MSNGIQVLDDQGGFSNQSIRSTLINCYSALTIPAYRRAIEFLSSNLASFGRSVRKGGTKIDGTHRLDRLLNRRPNAYQNATTFWRTLYFHVTHTGNAYARIEREPGTFRPRAIHILLPEDVRPVRYDRGDGSGPQQFYWHVPTKQMHYDSDVLHFQGLSYDGQAGADPIALHERTFQRAATLENYQTTYLQRGSVIRGSVTVEGEIDDDGIAQVKAEIRKYRGGEGEDDVLVLGNGAKFTNHTISPEASQIVGQVSATTKQISQATGVPPEFLYELTEAKYNAIVEQAGQFIVRYVFRPWIEMAEDELTSKLLTEADQDAGYSVHINPDALLRGSGKEQMEIISLGVRNGLYTENEGRGLLGLPPIDDPEANKLRRLGDTAPQPEDQK